MDARLVWDTWRRILTDDQLVERVLHPQDSRDFDSTGITAGEMAILADYASTPLATDTNISMYRRGLVRNALGALRLVPLTRHLLYTSELDVDAVAADFAKSNGYVDDGPNFWRIAKGFVEYLGEPSEFDLDLWRDVLALDLAMISLARRLGESAPEVWPEIAASAFHDDDLHDRSTRFVASRAAVVALSRYDLTEWIANPEDFDADEQLEPAAMYWLIYFPTADAGPAYAELSERTARAFNFLSTSMSESELSLVLDGVSDVEMLEIIDSLAKIGVVVRAEDPCTQQPRG
jgi:hypothetical protein